MSLPPTDAGSVALDRSGRSFGSQWIARLRGAARGATGGVAALTLIAAAIRWPTIAGPSFWVDEWVTRQIVSRPLLDALRAVKETESSPPLYYVLAWVWGHVFGTSEFALRSLSGLLGAATVPVAYAAGRALASPRTGLIAAAFVTTSPLLVWYSTEARSYALLILLGAITFLLFAQALARPDRRTLALWSLTASVALTAHYFAAFLLAAEWIVLLALQRSHRRTIALVLVAPAATAVALLPLVYWQSDHADWIAAYLPLTGRLTELPRVFAVGVAEPTAWAPAAVAVLVAVAVLLGARLGRQERRAPAIALAVGVLALSLPLVGAFVRDYVLARNLLVAWFPLALALAAVCGSRRAGTAGPLVAAALCTVWLADVAAIAADERLQRADWNGAARLIGPPPRDRLVLAWGEWGASPLGDELAGARRLSRREAATVTEITLLGTRRPAGRSCWSGSACNLFDVRPRAVRLPGFTFAGRREEGLFETLRFVAPRRERVTWRELSTLEPRHGPPAVWLQRASATP